MLSKIAEKVSDFEIWTVKVSASPDQANVGVVSFVSVESAGLDNVTLKLVSISNFRYALVSVLPAASVATIRQ